MPIYVRKTNRKFLSLCTTLKDDSSQTQRKYTHISERKKLCIFILYLEFFFRGGFYKRKNEEICGRGAGLEEEKNDRNNKKR